LSNEERYETPKCSHIGGGSVKPIEEKARESKRVA